MTDDDRAWAEKHAEDIYDRYIRRPHEPTVQHTPEPWRPQDQFPPGTYDPNPMRWYTITGTGTDSNSGTGFLGTSNLIAETT